MEIDRLQKNFETDLLCIKHHSDNEHITPTLRKIQELADRCCCLHEVTVVCGNLRLHISHAVLSRKSAHGQSTLQVCQTVGLVLFQVFDF